MIKPEKPGRRVRRVAVELFGADIGCSDGHCVFGHPGGMHTNGGCRCARDMPERSVCRMLGNIALDLAESLIEKEGEK